MRGAALRTAEAGDAAGRRVVRREIRWWPMSARLAIAAGLGLAGLAAAASWALPTDVRLDAESGHWKAASSGLRASQAAPLLRAGRRASLRFSLGTGEAAALDLVVSRRRAEQPILLRVSRDGETYGELHLRPEPLHLRVPVLPGNDSISLELEASGSGRPAFFVHAVTLDRERGGVRLLAWLAPALTGLLALGAALAVCGRIGIALAWAWLPTAGLGCLGALVWLWDPAAAHRLPPLTWLSLAGLWAAGSWLLAFFTRRALGLEVLAPYPEQTAAAPPRTLLGLEWRWAALVFAIAAALRLGFAIVVDQPLLYSHTYTYFNAGLRIATHADPIAYVLGSEEWRLWHMHWTIAPLYYVALGLALRLTGLDFFPIEMVQGLLDALTAVGVAALGRSVAGRHGAWAGVAYALYWPAIELTSWSMTEHLQTPLLVLPMAILAQPGPLGHWRHLGAGFLMGLGALARSVSIGLIGIAGLWRIDPLRMRRASLVAALLIGSGAAAAILPWTARNVFIIGEPVLIEDNGVFNLWYDNGFGNDLAERNWQEQQIQEEPDPAVRRELAMRFVREGMQRHPDQFARKVEANFWHFLRPEGLHLLLNVEASMEPWRLAAQLAFDDAPTLLALPLFVVFLVAGRASAARSLIFWWTLYYLSMVVVVFHNEIRYRSALIPLVLAGAAGGVATLLDRRQWRRPLVWLSLALGLYLVARAVGPFRERGERSLAASRAMAPVSRAVSEDRLDDAWRLTESASALAPRSGRPWLGLGRQLRSADRLAESLEAYRRAQARANPLNHTATVALPGLLRATGQHAEADASVELLNRISHDVDPWLVLETAWRELPPPRSDELIVGWDDYGAVRSFHEPLGDEQDTRHRWSRGRAWLRLHPTRQAASYELTLRLGSPEPSPHASPEVEVFVNGSRRATFRIEREVRPYRLVTEAPPPGEPLLVRLECPTWTRLGEPADAGVRVERLSVRPEAEAELQPPT